MYFVAALLNYDFLVNFFSFFFLTSSSSSFYCFLTPNILLKMLPQNLNLFFVFAIFYALCCFKFFVAAYSISYGSLMLCFSPIFFFCIKYYTCERIQKYDSLIICESLNFVFWFGSNFLFEIDWFSSKMHSNQFQWNYVGRQ